MRRRCGAPLLFAQGTSERYHPWCGASAQKRHASRSVLHRARAATALPPSRERSSPSISLAVVTRECLCLGRTRGPRTDGALLLFVPCRRLAGVDADARFQRHAVVGRLPRSRRPREYSEGTMAGSRLPVGTLGEVLASRRRRCFVGRDGELELVRAALDAREPRFSVLWFTGSGGIGKTGLLEAVADLAEEAGGWRVVRLDGREHLRWRGPPARRPTADGESRQSTARRSCVASSPICSGMAPSTACSIVFTAIVGAAVQDSSRRALSRGRPKREPSASRASTMPSE
jgi:hypothetical protein